MRVRPPVLLASSFLYRRIAGNQAPRMRRTELENAPWQSDTFPALHLDEFVVRVINGEEAEQDEYPFAEVSIRYRNGQHMCGASLIAPDMVLTAAHCADEDFGSIQIGRYDFADSTDTYETRNATATFSHPSFQPRILRFDFAVIQLSSAVENNYSLIRLNDNSSLPRAGDNMTVMGWGATDTDPWTFPNALQETTVEAISNSDCESFTLNNEQLYKGDIDDEMLCAFSLRTDACSGDSGGPLIVRRNGQATQVGVVSWGRSCAVYPGVYSRVSSGMDFIRPVICSHSSSPPEYLACSSDFDDDNDLWGETQQPSPSVVATAMPTVRTAEPSLQPSASSVATATPSDQIAEPSQPATQRPSFSPSSTAIPAVNLATPSPSLAPSPNTRPVLPPAGNQSYVTVIVDIQLDSNSGETGWYVSYEDDGTILNVPEGSYKNSSGYVVTQSLPLRLERTYAFVITDSAGDGLCCWDDGTSQSVGWYRVYVDDSEDPSEATTLLYGAGNFGAQEKRYFSLPVARKTGRPSPMPPRIDNPSPTAPAIISSSSTLTSSADDGSHFSPLAIAGLIAFSLKVWAWTW